MRCSWVGVGGVKASDACKKDCSLKDWFVTTDATAVQLVEDKDDKCKSTSSSVRCQEKGSLRVTQRNTPYGETQVLLKFDLSKYSGRAVEQAQLRIYTSDGGEDVVAYRMILPWDKMVNLMSLTHKVSAL